MPWWGWLLIGLGLVLFVPIKAYMVKKFFAKQKQKEKAEQLDE